MAGVALALLLLQACAASIHAFRTKRQSAQAQLNIVMIGNPGTGKSTILNGLIGEYVFKSGVSFGSGLTYKLDKNVRNGVTYMDTPGLADMKMREQAADAIFNAMMEGGNYKIVFVINLEAGRVKPEDVTTMKLVLEMLPTVDSDQFAILVNKISEKTLAKMRANDGAGEKMVITSLLSQLPKKTNFIGFAPFHDELDEEDSVEWKIDAGVKAFIESIPHVEIKQKDVKKFKLDKYEKQLEDMQAQLSELLEDQRHYKAEYEKVKAELARLQQRNPSFFGRVGEAVRYMFSFGGSDDSGLRQPLMLEQASEIKQEPLIIAETDWHSNATKGFLPVAKGQ